MKCPNCQAANDTTAKFCAECGTPLQQPRPATRPRPAGRISCSKCGASNPPDSVFCENCGSRLDRQARPAPAQARPAPPARPAVPAPQPASSARPAGATQQKQPTSAAWWLLPFFLFWVGGLIGFLVVRENDRGKANGLLIFGIVWTVVIMILSFAVSFIPFFVDF